MVTGDGNFCLHKQHNKTKANAIPGEGGKTKPIYTVDKRAKYEERRDESCEKAYAYEGEVLCR
jgi:hypothetical protein